MGNQSDSNSESERANVDRNPGVPEPEDTTIYDYDETKSTFGERLRKKDRDETDE